MERVWDYFMRRKGILGLVLIVSAVAGFISYRALDQNRTIPDHTYITIANWGEDPQSSENVISDLPEIQIPLTGGESPAPTYIVMSPRDLVQLPQPEPISQEENDLPSEAGLPEHDISITPDEFIADYIDSLAADPRIDTPDVPLVGEIMDESSVAMSGGTLNIFLSAVSFMLLILFGYLIYQHFYR